MKKQWYSVKITFGVNDVCFDEILGLNAEDALQRAQWNWPNEQVEVIAWEVEQ